MRREEREGGREGGQMERWREEGVDRWRIDRLKMDRWRMDGGVGG